MRFSEKAWILHYALFLQTDKGYYRKYPNLLRTQVEIISHSIIYCPSSLKDIFQGT